jgi:hypothetical protein
MSCPIRTIFQSATTRSEVERLAIAVSPSNYPAACIKWWRTTVIDPQEPSGQKAELFDLLRILEETIYFSDLRKQLAETLDNYAINHEEEFSWATGPQAPALLFNILLSIDRGCRDDYEQFRKSRPKLAGKRIR